MIHIADKGKTKDELRKDFDKKVKKTDEKKKEDYVRQIATRELLERDYKEDSLHVSFNTSPETRRSIEARKPNQEEFIKILSLSVEAAQYEGKLDAGSLAKMRDIYAGLHTMAANLSLDKKLNEEFWSKHIGFDGLQSFITELIVAFQTGTGVPESEMKSFR